jgi:hypothetical protein
MREGWRKDRDMNKTLSYLSSGYPRTGTAIHSRGKSSIHLSSPFLLQSLQSADCSTIAKLSVVRENLQIIYSNKNYLTSHQPNPLVGYPSRLLICSSVNCLSICIDGGKR